MAAHDLPAMVDYILNVTGNKQVVYVGHSQGTLIGFAKFSADLEFARKVGGECVVVDGDRRDPCLD